MSVAIKRMKKGTAIKGFKKGVGLQAGGCPVGGVLRGLVAISVLRRGPGHSIVIGTKRVRHWWIKADISVIDFLDLFSRKKRKIFSHTGQFSIQPGVILYRVR